MSCPNDAETTMFTTWISLPSDLDSFFAINFPYFAYKSLTIYILCDLNMARRQNYLFSI
jgi:hypothetical protein